MELNDIVVISDKVQPPVQNPNRPTKEQPAKHFNKTKKRNFPRGHQGNGAGPAKRSFTAYEKKDIPSSLSLPSRKRYYPVYTSNLGIPLLAKVMYRAIARKDYRLAAAISEPQLRYMLAISWYNRLTQTAEDLGYCLGVQDSSYLKKAAKGIQLPEVLAQYIEAIGQFTLPSSATLVPLCFRTFGEFCPGDLDQPEDQEDAESGAVILDADTIPVNQGWYYDYRRDLRAVGKPIPATPWHIDHDWIEDWNDASTRGSLRGIAFRRVDLSSLEGKEAIVVSRGTGHEDGDFGCFAPHKILHATGEVGCAYRFRLYGQRADWPGENKDLVFNAFVGPDSRVTTTINDMIVDSFTQRGLDQSV